MKNWQKERGRGNEFEIKGDGELEKVSYREGGLEKVSYREGGLEKVSYREGGLEKKGIQESKR